MDAPLRHKLAIELRAAADHGRRELLDHRLHTMLVFSEVNYFLHRDSITPGNSSSYSISTPEYSPAYTPAGTSRYSRFATDVNRDRAAPLRSSHSGSKTGTAQNSGASGSGAETGPKGAGDVTRSVSGAAALQQSPTRNSPELRRASDAAGSAAAGALPVVLHQMLHKIRTWFDVAIMPMIAPQGISYF